jgi:exosortase
MALDTNNRTWRRTVIILVVVTLLAVMWSYWSTFGELADEWALNPLYSHGYLVPAFAAVLLWLRRDRAPAMPLQPSWWALAFLAVGCVMRLGAAYFYFAWPDRISLLFMLFAAALALGGWAAVRWVWPSIVFLVFMLPFPGFVENNLTRPLRHIATLASTNVLQTMGFFAQADGNVIVLSEAELGIVEACSGLAMLSTFVALTVGACFVIQRPFWQKLVIVLSSVPIAVLCNVVRISATGIFMEVADSDFAHRFHHQFHDGAGWLMMPLALVLLLLEFKVLDLIFEIERVEPKSATSRAAPALG